MTINLDLSLSDIIDIVGIIVSLITSMIAIVISVKTLKQSAKMIEESTRPHISISIQSLHDLKFFVLKNFGNSTAKIIGFETNVDFKYCGFDDEHLPFSHIANTYLHPGERILSPINQMHKLTNKYTFLIFDITYIASGKAYTEHMEINLPSLADHANLRETVKIENASVVTAEALQDIAKILL